MTEQLTVNIDDSLTDLIPGFLERKRADILSIIEAASRHDYDTIARVAHRLKGEGGSYGFDRITELAGQLEQALKARDDAQIAQCIERLAAQEFDGPISRLRSGALVRSWAVAPFRIYYQRHPDELLIVRVYHQSRRPIAR